MALMLVVHSKRFLQLVQKGHPIQTPGMLTLTERALFQNIFSVFNQKSGKIYEQNILQDISIWKVAVQLLHNRFFLLHGFISLESQSSLGRKDFPTRSSHSNPATDFH